MTKSTNWPGLEEVTINTLNDVLEVLEQAWFELDFSPTEEDVRKVIDFLREKG